MKKFSLGSGNVKIPDFLSIDIDARNSPDIVQDIRQLDLPRHSVEVLYASHVVEHFPVEAGKTREETLIDIFSGWKNCLRPDGGMLYIAVPDLERLCKLLLEYPENSIRKSLVNVVYGGARNPYDIHYSGFTADLLSDLLYRAGFNSVESFEPFVDDESMHRICGQSISLNLKASLGKSDQPFSPHVSETAVNPDRSYQTVADERLVEIIALKRTCEERLSLVHDLSHTCEKRLALITRLQGEVILYRTQLEQGWMAKLKTRLKKLWR